MAATTASAGARNGSGAAARELPDLPPVSVFKFEEAQRLLELLVAENTDTFIAAGQAYRERHRKGTKRPLNAQEITVIASGLGVTLDDANKQIKDARLTHHAEPEPQELLLAAGVSTAPAFMESALRFVALIEMPDDELEEAAENGQVAAAIAARLPELRKGSLKEGRARGARALEHLADAAGVEPGKARRLVTGPVMQALWQAMTHLTNPQSPSASESSTSSPAPTGGIDGPSSTAPPGETPAT